MKPVGSVRVCKNSFDHCTFMFTLYVCVCVSVQDANSGSIVLTGQATAWSSLIMAGLAMKDTIDMKLSIRERE